MKITIVQGAFFPVPPIRGGALEKMWYRLGAEFSRQGHTVVHISRRCDGLPAESVELDVRHRRVQGYDQPVNRWALKWCDFLYTLRVKALVPKSDIIVTNTFWAPLLLLGRGSIYVSVQRMPKGQMRFYSRAARLHACSQAVADGITREDPASTPRVRTIPNPLPFVPGEPLDYKLKDSTILYVGRIHPEKGIQLLLEAFSRAIESGLKGWTLRLVGPAETGRGGGGLEWATQLKQRFPSQKILWLGPIYDEVALNREYRQAAIFTYPSLAENGETMGVAPLEAMAWGAIPIVSALQCFKDFVIDGKNGVVFDHRSPDPVGALSSAFLRLANQERGAMALSAMQVRETHSIRTIADRFLIDFKELAHAASR